MLELKPGCERCDRDLPPDSAAARICSFECTFCADCAERALEGRCPNCRGELVARPRRRATALIKYPAFAVRVYRPAVDDIGVSADDGEQRSGALASASGERDSAR